MSVGAQSAGPAPSENGGAPEGGGEELGYTGQYADQDSDAQGAGLYDLASAPEEVRPFLEGELKKIEGNVTRKFQEAAEFREKVGHLAEVEGLADLDAEELQGLMAFYKVSRDPDLFGQWLEQVGGSSGELDEDSWLEVGIENGWFDGDDADEEGDEGGLDVDELREQILGEVMPDIEAFREFQASQQEEGAVGEIQTEFSERLKSLVDEHGDALDVEEVLHMAHGYVAQGSEDPLGEAAERYLRIRGSAESGVVDDKLEQREKVLAGGVDDTRPEGYGHNSPELKKAALSRFSQ